MLELNLVDEPFLVVNTHNNYSLWYNYIPYVTPQKVETVIWMLKEIQKI